MNALVLGKVMLVAETLELGRGLARNRLIVAVLLRSVLFAILFLLFDSVEKSLVHMLKSGSAQLHFPVSGQSFLATLILAVILAVALVPFFLFTEFSRVLGADRVRALLMGPLAPSARTHSRA